MRTNVHANLEEPEEAGSFAVSQNAAMTTIYRGVSEGGGAIAPHFLAE